MPTRCGHSSGSSAARASIAIGDDSGKTAAAIPLTESGLPIDFAVKPNSSTWAKVAGSDMVWTSRAVDAWAPMIRKAAPNSK